MSLRALTLVPALFVLLVFAGLLLAGMPEVGVRIEIELVKVVALVGSLAAARAFERGDYLRKAWHLSAACFGFLLVRDALVVGGGTWDGPYLLIAALVLASNVCGVASAWLMARTFNVAGLATAESTRRLRLLTGLGFVTAVLVTAPSLVLSLNGAERGELRAVVWFISGIGDVLAIALIAPVLLTAVAMRGGALTYPWALLTAGMVAWLLYDLAGTLEHLSVLEPVTCRAIEELFRGLACVYTGAAGFAQRKIVREGAA